MELVKAKFFYSKAISLITSTENPYSKGQQ